MLDVINTIDRDDLRDQVRNAPAYPHFKIDNFLDAAFAEEVHTSFPTFDEVAAMGQGFSAVNERGKIQVTDSSNFSPPMLRLHEALASQEFLDLMSYAMDIPNLLADPELVGGGIHATRSRGHLDVHVDFNYIEERNLHRRMNILVFLNKDWEEEYGGCFEVWDQDVKTCHNTFLPVFNRCCAFATSDISYHGVTAVKCPEDRARQSFAAYYYTEEAPPHWTGEAHSTIFKARPDEKLKGAVLMPAENAKRGMRKAFRRVKSGIKKVVKKG